MKEKMVLSEEALLRFYDDLFVRKYHVGDVLCKESKGLVMIIQEVDEDNYYVAYYETSKCSVEEALNLEYEDINEDDIKKMRHSIIERLKVVKKGNIFDKYPDEEDLI